MSCQSGCHACHIPICKACPGCGSGVSASLSTHRSICFSSVGSVFSPCAVYIRSHAGSSHKPKTIGFPKLYRSMCSAYHPCRIQQTQQPHDPSPSLRRVQCSIPCGGSTSLWRKEWRRSYRHCLPFPGKPRLHVFPADPEEILRKIRHSIVSDLSGRSLP